MHPENFLKIAYLVAEISSHPFPDQCDALTSVVCKLLETLVRDHMVEFLVKHKLINTSQHGFLKARSCLTNLLCFRKKLQSG